MIFYGTGGAEGVPTPFCRCGLCAHARQNGGRDFRRRSMLRLTDTCAVDFGPDIFSAAAAFGDLAALQHVLITHTHEDHFHLGLIEARALSTPKPAAPLHFYLAGQAYTAVALLCASPLMYGGKLPRYVQQGLVAFHQLAFGQAQEVDGLQITSLRGNHPDNMGGRAANYLIGLPGGETLFYAVDTGWPPAETLAFLVGRQVDVLVCECTWGAREGRGDEPDNHLDIFSVRRLAQVLAKQGTLHGQSRIFLTHINHKQQATHAQLQAMADEMDFPCAVAVAYDGLRF